MSTINILAALGGGIASFACPCHLPLIPVYAASLVGPELSSSSARRLPLFLHSLFFVLGLGLFLALIGGLAIVASDSLNAHALLVTYVSIGILIAMGLYMLLIIPFPKINYECHIPVNMGVKGGYLRSFIIGAVYSFLHSPCSTPSLIAVTALAMSSGSGWAGASLFFFYFLGYGVPFLAGGLAFGALMPFFKKVAEYRNFLYAMSGTLLVCAGLIILLRII